MMRIIVFLLGTLFLLNINSPVYGAPYGSGIYGNDPYNGCNREQGDADCNGTVEMPDYEIWRREFLQELQTQLADFNSDGKVSLIDFEIWRMEVKQ